MNRRLASGLSGLAAAARRYGEVPRTGYIGWAGHANVGDDAMYGAAQALVHGGLDVLGSPGFESRLATIGLGGPALFKRAVLGGGTLVNDGYLAQVEQCLEWGLPMAALGTGVGSAGFASHDEGISPQWVEALRRFEAVGVRGPLSRAKLVQAGHVGAEIVGDLALALTPSAPSADWHGRRFLVNFAPARRAHEVERLQRAERALRAAIEDLVDKGWQPVPVAFDRADMPALARLLDGFASSETVVLRSFEQYRRLGSTTALSIGIRLHSAVFAAACGVVPILLGYRDKCLDFAGSLEDDRMVVLLDEVEPDVLIVRARDAVDDLEAVGRGLHARCRGFRHCLEDFAARLFSPAQRAADRTDDGWIEPG